MMMRSPFSRHRKAGCLLRDERGAVAVTYALALTGLIASAGVSFDYARLASLSSEMHSAADQAALAAATQLDGTSSAIADATLAASNLVHNTTLLANDNIASSAVTVAGLVFYTTYADAEAGTNPTTDSTKAKFVRVSVNARQAFYAFTPIVGLVSSGNVAAAATAGLGSSICKVPPVFLCNPPKPVIRGSPSPIMSARG
jgi:Flp pilus assembly protein TadG